MTDTEENNINVRTHYTIAGGLEGRDRLRVIGRVCRADTLNLLHSIKLESGARCVDLGCGGGDVSLELAKLVGPSGSVLGLDADQNKLALAAADVDALGFTNVTFQTTDITQWSSEAVFNLVYSRFLFSHLSDPMAVLSKFVNAAKPGATVALEDIDFSSYLCYPANDDVEFFTELYRKVVRKTGADPHIGQRLPSLMKQAGLHNIQVKVVQPVQGEAKDIAALSLIGIRESVLQHGLVTESKLDATIAGLQAFAKDPDTVLSVPRIVQVSGEKAAN